MTFSKILRQRGSRYMFLEADPNLKTLCIRHSGTFPFFEKKKKKKNSLSLKSSKNVFGQEYVAVFGPLS